MSNCNVCGAPIEPLEIKCKFCGTAIKSESVNGASYISELKLLLQKIDDRERAKSGLQKTSDTVISIFQSSGRSPALISKLDAISTFAMPSDAETLMQFFMFCHGNASVKVDFGDESGKALKEAWTGKSKMAFGQLKILSSSNTKIATVVSEFEKIYGANAKKFSLNKFHYLIIGGLICFTLIFFMSNSENKEKSSEQERIQLSINKAQQLFSDKKFEEAAIEASNITWRLKPNSNKKLVQTYDQQRTEILNQIKNAKSDNQPLGQ